MPEEEIEREDQADGVADDTADDVDDADSSGDDASDSDDSNDGGSREDSADTGREDSRSDSRSSSRGRDDAGVSELERRAIAAEERARVLEEMQQRQQQRGRSPEEEEERRRLMTPEERMNETLQQGLNSIRQESAKAEFLNRDAADRRAFMDGMSKNPLYKKYEKEVEDRLLAMRKKGQNVDRESLLYYVVGSHTMKSVAKGGGTQQKKRAEANVRNARTNSTNARSDVNSTRRTGSTAKERLNGVFI